jgi:hypothetical protein
MTSALAPAPKRLTEVRQPERVTVTLECCSEEDYAQRIAKPNEVKGYIVPGYLAA